MRMSSLSINKGEKGKYKRGSLEVWVGHAKVSYWVFIYLGLDGVKCYAER